jgi:hypothetical protein
MFLSQCWVDKATEQALTKAVHQAALGTVSLFAYLLHLLIAYHVRINRSSGIGILLCGLSMGSGTTMEAANRIYEICSNALTLANTDYSITKALVSLNLDLPSATVHCHHQGQDRIKSEDNAFFATFGWTMEPLRQVLGEQSAWILLANHGFRDCSLLLPEVRWRIVAKTNSRKSFKDQQKV